MGSAREQCKGIHTEIERRSVRCFRLSKSAKLIRLTTGSVREANSSHSMGHTASMGTVKAEWLLRISRGLIHR